ncbi:phosphoethanolamine transferase domain-containing protein [Aeromonas sp. MdU4]|uniref:phosphoethanolamine transferase domain-containing protein n=1 Tax=Aeromonas sp. MdU4 TaxID=3342819 RepID=UPI0035B7014D
MPFWIKMPIVPLISLLSLYFSFMLNWRVTLHFYEITFGFQPIDVDFAISFPVILVAALNCLFILFSFRYLIKPISVTLILLSSAVSYAMIKYNIPFDGTFAQRFFETNMADLITYIDLPMLGWIIISGAIPSLFFISVEIEYSDSWLTGFMQRITSISVSLILISSIIGLYYEDYEYVYKHYPTLQQEIVPLNIIDSAIKYIYARHLPAYKKN